MGAKVFVFDNLSYGKMENVSKNARFYRLDLKNFISLKNALMDISPDIIFHLAAVATTKENEMGWRNPLEDYVENAVNTLNVFRTVVDLDIDPKIVYASSAAVYGAIQYTPIDEDHPTNPISPYGISKLAGEKYAYAYFSEYGVKSTTLRIFNTYGPRQLRYVMLDFMKKLYNNPNNLEVLGTGNQIRDYCYVSDTVNAFILASSTKVPSEVAYNVSGGNPVSIKDVAHRIINTLNLCNKTRISYTSKSWMGDITTLVADISKAKSQLQFEPQINLDIGLTKLRDWFLTTI